MRYSIVLFLLLVAFATDGLHAEQQAITATSNVTINGKEEPWRYWLHLPEGYEADSAKHYPLMLFLHGSSLRGRDLKTLKRYGPPQFLDKRPEFPMIVVSPQLPAGGWPPEELAELLDEIETLYRVDKHRIYLTGTSLGGQGAWALAEAASERFAAFAPVCGYGWESMAKSLTDLPIRGYHGDDDKIVRIEPHRALINKIIELGGNAELIEIEGGTHSSIIFPIYKDEKLYEWFLQHRRE